MWSSTLGLCLLLALFHGGEPSASDPQYMLLVPSLLSSGKEQTFCLQLSHLNESVDVTVSLQGQQNITLLEKHVTESEEDICTTFQTPNVEKPEMAFVTFDAVGGSLHFKTKRSVLIKNTYNLAFIQSDKPIYKPGQEVKFRVATLDETFHAIYEKFPVIFVEDPQRNRIFQWVNVETKRGIAQKSFLLTSEPRLGSYKLVAQREKGSQIQHTFSVEEYVLPKYEVKVTMDPVITILDEEIKITACGKYTYGKPVAGRIDARVCRKFSYSYTSCPDDTQDAVCEELSHEADNTGCFSEVIKTKIFQMKRTGYENKLTATAKITEEGTGVQLTGDASSEIKNTITKVSFQQLDSRFKRGIPLYGQVFLEDAAGKPISNETVTLFVGSDGKNYSYITGPDGRADFSIETTNFSRQSITLRVAHKEGRRNCYSQSSRFPVYQDDSRTVNHFYSRSSSYLKIQPIFRTLKCEEDENLVVHYTLTPEGVGDMKHAVFHHLIMSKGNIIKSGNHKVDLNAKEESHGQFTFKLPVNIKTAPLAKVLVYLILDNGEVIADSVSFKVGKCFSNKVKISFSNNEVLPGANTNLAISSLPNSLCALRAVDSSVRLLKPETELSADTVYNLLSIKDLSGYNHEGFNLEEPREDPCLQVEPIFLNGVYYNPSVPTWDADTYQILKDFGLKVFTNTVIRIPVLCMEPEPVIYYDTAGFRGGQFVSARLMSEPMAMSTTHRIVGAGEVTLETVRQDFPETWLWDLIFIDDVGQTDLKLTVPDTITTWNVDMFCTSEEAGFGLAVPASLLIFQPFFLELTMPYSAIRGEKFILKVSVFNYMPQTIGVDISMDESNEFTAKKANTADKEHCIQANGRVTVEYEVVLKSLGNVKFAVSAQTLPGGGLCGNEIVNPMQGRKDTVIKHLLVEPEGIEKEETHSAMICGQGPEITEAISLKLPSRLVEGSQRAYFSVIGDIMGTAMQNIGNLLQMPSGCGEQNIALFTPNTFILDYLNNTGQLTPEVKSKALSYLSTGYQRQLTYKHQDGSYSAFGPRYGEGNTWLTAFVVRSYYKAQSHIYIDPKQISDSLTWLLQKQKENGCFHNQGTLFNNALKGGVNDEVALAAYITITLLEMKMSVTHLVVNGALLCLEKALDSEMDLYTEAMLSYAFTLAGKHDLRSRLLHDLDGKAIKLDGSIHWHRPESSESPAVIRPAVLRPRSRKPPSMDIELNSYILLAMIHKHNLTDQDLTHAAKVVSWIVNRQNPTGGFSSTQDTVVALQALATYGYLTHKHAGPRDVAVTLGEASIAKLHVEDSNRLLLQKVPLPEMPADYTVSVNGPGCVFVQSTLKYNIPPPEGEAPFNITITTVPEDCNPKSFKSFGISVNVSYIGSRVNSNMALVEIKLPSGYIPVKSSVKQLSNQKSIQKAESHPNKVVVYFEKLSRNIENFKFFIEQDIPVNNLQPAIVKVFDYYEPDNFAVTKYSAPCSSEGDIRYE